MNKSIGSFATHFLCCCRCRTVWTDLHSYSRTEVLYLLSEISTFFDCMLWSRKRHWWIQWGALGVNFYSISCSFRERNVQNNRLAPSSGRRPYLGNLVSTTERYATDFERAFLTLFRFLLLFLHESRCSVDLPDFHTSHPSFPEVQFIHRDVCRVRWHTASWSFSHRNLYSWILIRKRDISSNGLG